MKKGKILSTLAVTIMATTIVAGCGSATQSASSVQADTAQEGSVEATENITTEANTESEATEDTSSESESANELSEEPDTTQESEEATMPALVDTTYGTLMGTLENGTYIFKGIPYAKAERFEMPEDPDSWEGIRTAMVYGEGAPNSNDGVSVTDYMTPSGTDNVYEEDCQFLNVWTNSIESDAKKPVIFWIHGGGWSNGASNELSYYDGYNFAQTQDAVFVSINHRLNVLGYTDLSAYGDEYQYSGNVGVADMVKALEWVNENIENFGGDPSNVTIMGQSGGGAKVMTLLGVPSAAEYFQKAICCSGGVSGIDQETAQAAGTTLVEKCKTEYSLTSDDEALEMLKTMPYDELLTLSTDTGVGQGPVVDGDYYPAKTVADDGTVSDLAKDKPLIVSTTFSEISSGQMSNLTIAPAVAGISANMPVEAYLPTFCPALQSDEVIQQNLEAAYPDNLDEVLEAFHEAFPNHEDADLLCLDNSTLSTAGITILDAFAAESNAPVYRMFWAEKFPIFGGMTAYHTGGDLPFLFGNIEMIDYMTAGDNGSLNRIQDEATEMLGNFLRTGDPSFGDITFTPYTSEDKSALIFDNDVTEMRNDFDGTIRALLPIPTSFF